MTPIPGCHTNQRQYLRGPDARSLDFDCDCAVLSQEDAPRPGVLPLPTIYALELTPACNHHCIGCSNVFAPHQTPLALETWEQVLDTIAPHAQRLKLTGGEPTCHPQFARLVEAVNRRGIPFTLFTNGCWHRPDEVLSLLQRSPTCAGLLISLHGATAQSHEAFTNAPGSFAETCATIQHATRAGLRVATNTVMTRYAVDEVAQVIHLSQSLGATSAIFNRYIGRPWPDLAPAPADLARALSAIEHTAAPHAARLGTCIPLCFAETSAAGCLAGTAYCTIDPWGSLRPCNHAPQVVGNLLTQSLHTLWHSEAMQQWRALLPEGCTACAHLSQCRGGCRAAALLHQQPHDPLIPA
jgi:AdoMet-dependent heme synthase